MILSTALWVSLFLLPATLPAEELSLKEISNDITWNSEIRSALLLFENGVYGRRINEIDDSIYQLAEVGDRLHTTALPFVIELLIKRGETLLLSGESELGIHLLEEISSAFPADYLPYFKLSKAYLSFSVFHPVSGISRFWKGVKVYLASKARKEVLGNYAVQALLINLTITGYMVVLVFFSKHFREVFFDLARIFHLPQRTALFILTAVCFFMLPIKTGGFPALMVTLTFLLWPYLKNLKERCLVLGFTLLIAWVTLFQVKLPGNLSSDNEIQTLRLEEFSKNSWDRETLTLVEKLIIENGDSVWLNVAKGLMYKWNGDANRSYAIFRRLLKEFPDNPDVLINMGNYSLTTGRIEAARALYQRALSTSPDMAEARYNLSITLDAMMEFDRAREEFDKAYSLDSSKIQVFLDNTKGKPGSVRPMDKMPTGEPPAINVKADRVNTDVATPLGILSDAVRSEYNPVVSGMLAIFLSVFLGFRQKLNSRPIEECDECGTIFHSGSKCRLCTALMLPHSRVEPLERKKVLGRLGNYQFTIKISPIILNLIGPGAGLIFRDMVIAGLFLLSGYWALFLLAMLSFLGADAPIYTETAFFLLAAYYLITNILLFRGR